MATELTESERRTVAYALRHPRGRYSAERAAQLSGIPKSTVYNWRTDGVLRPDYPGADPVMWSYRDLGLLAVGAFGDLAVGVGWRPVRSRTRIPTSALFALSTERQLPVDAIVDLYPGLTPESVELERRLRGIELPEPAFA